MKKNEVIVILLLCFFFFSCASTKCPVINSEEINHQREILAETGKIKFEDGVQFCSKDILFQMDKNCESGFAGKNLVINSFLVNDSGKRIKYQPAIENIIKKEMDTCFNIAKVDNNIQADYILEGVVFYEKDIGDDTFERNPKLYLSVIDNATGIIRAAVNTPIHGFDLEPEEMDAKDPILDKDKNQEIVEAIVKLPVGEKVPDAYGPNFDFRKLLEIGDHFYFEKDYDRAVEYYQQALEKKDELGEAGIERVYEKLYQVLTMKGDIEKAKEYRQTRINVRLEAKQKIDIALRFKKNSVSFLDHEKEESESLVQSVANYLKNYSGCLAIFGHCSKTGGFKYNCDLSRRRAVHIKESILNHVAQMHDNRIDTKGRGFLECKRCKGEDDEDRRVEFKLLPCDSDFDGQFKSCEELAEEMGLNLD